MRGLVGNFVENVGSNPNVKLLLKKDQERPESNDVCREITGKENIADREIVSRESEVKIMLGLDEYAPFKKSVMSECEIGDDEVANEINGLVRELNAIAHSPLCHVLDPPSPTACFVTNQLTFGKKRGKLLKCIAEEYGVRYLILS